HGFPWERPGSQPDRLLEALMKFARIAVLASSVLVAFPAHARQSPSDFLTDAMKGDNSEIKLGQLAQAKGASPETKNFGATLVTDDTKANPAVTDAASAMGVTHTDDASPEALAEYTKLSAMSGAAFDREFAHYMVLDHQQDIKKFEAQAGSGDAVSTL